MFFGTQNYANGTQNVDFETQKIGFAAQFFLSWHIKPLFGSHFLAFGTHRE